MFNSLSGSRVLLTGNTGFKGSWYTKMLRALNSEVFGLSLDCSPHGLHVAMGLDEEIKTYYSDICDLRATKKIIKNVNPDLVVHFAAQALVIDSYSDPIRTFLTNAIGTANVLESARSIPRNKGTLIITTDKVYRNLGLDKSFVESDALGGSDPYSASKACAEIIADVWRNSSLNENESSVATARAGNVIGGGDQANNRLVPDLLQAFRKGEVAKVRNPYAIRPWQHVLDPLMGYTELLSRMINGSNNFNQYNFGPSVSHTVKEVADKLADEWGQGASWKTAVDANPVLEAKSLKLDSSQAKIEFSWENVLSLEDSLKWIVGWEKSKDKANISNYQISEYLDKF